MRGVIPLLMAAMFCSCSTERKPEPSTPPAAHTVTSDGTPVSGAPEPEVVELRKVETVNSDKHVTMENVTGEYVLVCVEAANDKEKHPVQSCLSPRPGQNYLLFRANTRWLVNGAKDPINLAFMQNWSVKYNRGENIGLMSAKRTDAEEFGVYWLLSWTEKKSGSR